jgi:hypothetical protein
MPAGLLPDEGIADQLYYILSAPIAGVLNWQLILWTNDYTPSFDTTFADLTEATWGGYSRMILDRSTWTPPDVNMGCATSTYGTDPISYTVTDGPEETNYGVAYLDPGSGVLRFVQRFDDADISPIEIGGQFSILPQYTLTSAACGTAMARANRKIRRAKGEKKRG